MSIRIGLIVAAVFAITAPSALRAQTAKSEMIGIWQGDGVVLVPWVQQRRIPVTLTILANDSVGGTVGDARLVGGWFATRDQRSPVGLRWKTDYVIVANLDGPIVRNEGIWRTSVQIPLNWNGIEFAGGLATSGWRTGSIEHRKVEANLVLQRVVVTSQSPARRRSRP